MGILQTIEPATAAAYAMSWLVGATMLLAGSAALADALRGTRRPRVHRNDRPGRRTEPPMADIAVLFGPVTACSFTEGPAWTANRKPTAP